MSAWARVHRAAHAMSLVVFVLQYMRCHLSLSVVSLYLSLSP